MNSCIDGDIVLLYYSVSVTVELDDSKDELDEERGEIDE